MPPRASTIDGAIEIQTSPVFSKVTSDSTGFGEFCGWNAGNSEIQVEVAADVDLPNLTLKISSESSAG